MSTEKSTGVIAIRTYIDPAKDNMGLQNYNLGLFEGIKHHEPLACLEKNGVKRYITGLNEFAPELKKLPKEEMEAAILDIRKTVSMLEQELNSNFVEPSDPEFWNKVKLVSPSNYAFWDNIFIQVGNDPVFLNPKDSMDIIKLRAIDAGGFSIVAKNLDAARKSMRQMKFYLDRFEETSTIRTEVKKIRNRALAELQKLFEKNSNKLFYVCKVVDANSPQYKKSTPLDVLYDNMDKYINGETVETDKRKTATKFLEIASLDMEQLKIRAMIKDATFYKILALRGDGFIYHIASSTMVGKNPSEIVEFLRNPLNEQILSEITKTIETYWNA